MEWCILSSDKKKKKKDKKKKSLKKKKKKKIEIRNFEKHIFAAVFSFKKRTKYGKNVLVGNVVCRTISSMNNYKSFSLHPLVGRFRWDVPYELHVCRTVRHKK